MLGQCVNTKVSPAQIYIHIQYIYSIFCQGPTEDTLPSVCDEHTAIVYKVCVCIWFIYAIYTNFLSALLGYCKLKLWKWKQTFDNLTVFGSWTWVPWNTIYIKYVFTQYFVWLLNCKYSKHDRPLNNVEVVGGCTIYCKSLSVVSSNSVNYFL